MATSFHLAVVLLTLFNVDAKWPPRNRALATKQCFPYNRYLHDSTELPLTHKRIACVLLN